jgi:hypothetical protein
MNMNGFMLVGVEEKDKSEIFKNLRHGCLFYKSAAKIVKKNDVSKFMWIFL